MAAAQMKARAAGESPGWWLTTVTWHTCCARCAKVLRRDVAMVYRARPREALCVECADGDPALSYRPWVRWGRHRRAAMKRQSRRVRKTA